MRTGVVGSHGGCCVQCSWRCAWRDLPERFGPWRTVQHRFYRWAEDGTWQRLPAEVKRVSGAAGELDWTVSVDSPVVRAHPHAAAAKGTPVGTQSVSRRPEHQDPPGRGGRGHPLSLLVTRASRGMARSVCRCGRGCRCLGRGVGRARTTRAGGCRQGVLVASDSGSCAASQPRRDHSGTGRSSGHRRRRDSRGGRPPAFESGA